MNDLVYTANTVSALVQAKTRLPESEKGLLYYRVTRSRTIALNISYNIADRAEAGWADLHNLGQGECATPDDVNTAHYKRCNEVSLLYQDTVIMLDTMQDDQLQSKEGV